MPYYGRTGNYAAGDNYGGSHYPYQAGGFSLKKLLTPPKFIRNIVNPIVQNIPIVGPIHQALTTSTPRPAVLPPPRQSGLINIGGHPQQHGLINIGTTPGSSYITAPGLARRYRRMNVTNVRALRRAGRRVRGFLKLAGRLGALPITAKGKKLFKRRKRACR